MEFPQNHYVDIVVWEQVFGATSRSETPQIVELELVLASGSGRWFLERLRGLKRLKK